MKTIISKTLHWLSLSIISILLILVILLALLRFANPYIKKHHQDIEKFVSTAIQQPISIKTITTGNNGLEPVLKLHDVTIFNDQKTKPILQVDEFQIGIDLIGSLIKWSIKPGLLLVRGADLSIRQDKNGGIHVSGIKGTLNDSDSDSNPEHEEILKWLFEQSKIDLSNIILTCNLASGEILKFTNLQLKLLNSMLQHDLKINGKLMQNRLPAKFDIDLKIRGDFLKQTISSLSGDVFIDDWSFKIPQQLSGNDSFTPQSGNINLLLKDPKITISLLRQPMPINIIKSKLIWQNTKKGLDIKVNNLKYKDEWLAVNGNLQLLFPTETSSPIVDINLGFKLANLAKAKLYYPATLLPPGGLIWLDQAFIDSKPMTGTLVLKGPIDKFPFDNDEGQFLAKADIRNVHLDYEKNWPPVKNLTGKMVFSKRSMEIKAKDSKIMRAPVASIKATIPNLDIPILTIDSDIHTDSKVGLEFIGASPLKKTIGGNLEGVNLKGPLLLNLKMDIPLSNLAQQKETKVDGNIVLHDNNLKPFGLSFGLENINGELHFTENDLTSNEIKGDLFNKPVQLTVKTLAAKNNDTITQVNITGNATVKNIEEAFSIKQNPYITGDFKYNALLELHSTIKNKVFKLNSDLHGITIDLPKPFDKTITGKGDINLTYSFGENEPANITINYNDQINAALAIKKEQKAISGEIIFGSTPAKIPTSSGITISGNIKKLDLPVWKDYLSRASSNFTGTGNTIKQINLEIDTLHAFDKIFEKVTLQATPKNNGWEIAAAMPTIKGKVFFPDDPKKQIHGVFQKLDLGKGQQDITELKPKDLPPLNLVINNFRYNNKIFKKVELVTQRNQNGLAINQLTITDPKFNLTANGSWSDIKNKQQSILRGKINSEDVGEALKQLKVTDNLIGGKSEANFDLSWPRALYDPTLKDVKGTIVINAQKGRIINLDKSTEKKLGFGKVLNLLSLRHLSLNFDDLTKKGFGFDNMIGDCELNNGNALAKNIVINGPIAQIKAHGKIGLADQNYDLTLSITPHITSSVPVAAAFAGGPVIGFLSMVVADVIVAPILKKATTYNYHVTGSLDNPILTKI